ncbi:MAG: hypothetical protein QOI83_992 [Streptomycetaceae bacterium]|nr:hypothetical protein [Streptomycetaceae bacterium]
MFARSKVGNGTLHAEDCSAARATAAMTDIDAITRLYFDTVTHDPEVLRLLI